MCMCVALDFAYFLHMSIHVFYLWSVNRCGYTERATGMAPACEEGCTYMYAFRLSHTSMNANGAINTCTCTSRTQGDCDGP